MLGSGSDPLVKTNPDPATIPGSGAEITPLSNNQNYKQFVYIEM